MKNNVNSLKTGDRIGNNGMVFIRRNRDAELNNDYGNTMVDAACPYCGTVKTYQLGNIINGLTTSCGCGHRTGRKHIPQRTQDNQGNISYEEGYRMNFGWVYDSEASDIGDIRFINVHSRWDESDKAVMPMKELDPVLNKDRVMFYSRWAKSKVNIHNVDLTTPVKASYPMYQPNRMRGTILAEGEDYSVSVQYHGADEFWIKSLLLENPEVAKNVRDMAYVGHDAIFGVTKGYFGDCIAKYADLRTVTTYNGLPIDIYEEYDSNSHRIDNPSERDVKVELGCADYNKGLFRISTTLKAFKDRDEKTILAIRDFAMKRIREHIIYNYKVGSNVMPTVIRVTASRGIEEGYTDEDKIVWNQICAVPRKLAIYA